MPDPTEAKMRQCNQCGKAYAEGTGLLPTQTDEHEHVCPECAQDYVPCALCGSYFQQDATDNNCCETCNEFQPEAVDNLMAAKL